MKRKLPIFGDVYATIGTALLALLSASTASATDLAVRIESLSNSEGYVRVALHQRVDGVDFPDEAGAVAGTFSRAVAGPMRFVFADLPPGEYAVAAFHDQNGDGELGTDDSWHSHGALRVFQRCTRLRGTGKVRKRSHYGQRGRCRTFN